MKKTLFHLTLVVLLLLIGLSIYGAFLGAERAEGFFNSLPLAVYWIFTAVLVIACLFVFRTLSRAAVFLMHLGTVLVLLGSMAASEKGHLLREAFGGPVKPVESVMVLHEGESGNELYERSTNQTFQLPFSLHLTDFAVLTYPAFVTVHLPDGRRESLAGEVGSELTLAETGITIRVVEVFENFKVSFEDGQRRAEDSAEPGRNPAVELAVIGADGSIRRRYVFERFAGHTPADDGLGFSYHRPVRDYISRVEVVRDGEVVESAAIEVNHPLHFGGFHFYQYSYDDKDHHYTVLKAVSDTGLSVVYLGYGSLCVGVVWYFWLIRLKGHLWR